MSVTTVRIFIVVVVDNCVCVCATSRSSLTHSRSLSLSLILKHTYACCHRFTYQLTNIVFLFSFVDYKKDALLRFTHISIWCCSVLSFISFVSISSAASSSSLIVGLNVGRLLSLFLLLLLLCSEWPVRVMHAESTKSVLLSHLRRRDWSTSGSLFLLHCYWDHSLLASSPFQYWVGCVSVTNEVSTG